MATPYPTITFQVNLHTVNALSHLPPDRHRTDQDAVIDDLNAKSDTRTFVFENGVAYRHGDKFTLYGQQALRMRDLMNAGNLPVVECDLGDDINCVADIGGEADVTATATATATMRPNRTPTTVAGGNGYSVDDVLSVVGGTSTTTATLDVTSVKTILSQDEANFAGGEDMGTFTAGTGYAGSDTITLSDGTVVTVDTVGGGGDVTAFTITTISTTAHTADGDVLTQSSTSGVGTGFTLTLGLVNQQVFAATYTESSEIPVGEYSVLPSNPVSTTGNSAGSGGATFTVLWGVRNVTVTDGGNNYASAPAVSFSGTGGSGTTATAVLDGDMVDSITVTASGSGYTATATVTIDAP